jgi:hypothetical protein
MLSRCKRIIFDTTLFRKPQKERYLAKLLLIGTLVCLMPLLGCHDTNSSRETVGENFTNSVPGETSSALTVIENQIVEASCGQCQFGLAGSECNLAVRINGESYFVDGSSIDDHGDAHGEDGLCNCIRTATVTGKIEDGRFSATAIEVLPHAEPSDDSPAK